MKLCIVLNASAGSLVGKKLADTEALITDEFAKTDAGIVILKPEGKDLTATLERAAGGDYDAVVVGGGDGTIATAASIFSKHGMPLGILPLGTMNMLAHDLNVPIKLEDAVIVLAGGAIRAIDMGEVNGETFLCNSAIGLVPTLGRARENQRGKPIWEKLPALVKEWVAVLYDWRGRHLILDYNGKSEHVITRLLTIADNEYTEAAKGFLHRECLDSGKLAVYVSRHKSRLGLLWFSLGVLFHFWQKDKRLETITTSEITVNSRRGMLSVCNDGEIKRMKCPLTYKIIPKALKVIAPEESAQKVAA